MFQHYSKRNLIFFDNYIENQFQDISMIGIATMDTGVNQTLSKKFLSRFNITVVPDPSEDSFSKIFSTTLGLEFKVAFKM